MTPYILIIDDSKIVRDALVWLLEADGLQIITAENGWEALQKVNSHSHPPCIIVLDLLMPHIDGFEFRKIQHQNPAWASIPTIINSALVDTNAFQLFPNEIILGKPFAADQFYEAIQSILSKQLTH